MMKENNLRPWKIQVEIETRWNYTYIMLQQAYEYRIPIQQVHNKYNINSDDWLNFTHWEDVKEYVELLEIFYNATLAFSRQFYPTVTEILAYLAEIARVLQEYKYKPGYQAAIFDMTTKFKK